MKKLLSLCTACCLATASVAGCADPDGIPDIPTPAPGATYQPVIPAGAQFEAAGSVTARPPQFENLLGSLRPDDKKPEERVPGIVTRGRIIVGVDQSHHLLSFRDPVSGELRGFEVDLAKQIAQDIFGSPDRVDFRFVDSADTVKALESGQVDIMLRSLSITRAAQDQVFFSIPYLSTGTRMLVLESSGLNSIEDLSGRTACALQDSTAGQLTRQHNPRANIMNTKTWSDCLVMLQQGNVDAIVAHDTILAGMAAQDPYLRIVGRSLSLENYGVAIATPGTRHDTTGLIRQVNSTIERIVADGTWWEMYNRWLAVYQFIKGPPPIIYRPEGEQ
ncbi:ABC transporter glutamine-binding protein GlnH precursor [Corynebacterium kalinowskii]|uniref:ABC transporter glutamine-binding protein GlnH n=1 Tax=Corynebacterium kalinowskii TaxID=2675216 RepID=A0A6B8VI03_9CORY|nr:glutamate ABC transporter substrate-binding protein [Corynebacterium kalinowskii]QGU01214.1 ABC transporter glutamine-binding protein GlnH precursor [Corynebacterium kalinowskii]